MLSENQIASLPTPQSAQVFLDFDGTITCRDVLDELILRYAKDDSWKEIEVLWQSGQIGSLECLSREFGLLDVSRHDLDQFLDQVEIDPGTLGLLHLLQRHRVPTAILSDGIDFFIERILRRHRIAGIPIRANSLVLCDGRWVLKCPWVSRTCASAAAHCKCGSVNFLHASGRETIYVGDGRSDLCIARKANVVFAKHVLAAAMKEEEREFIPYATLGDVTVALAEVWAAEKVVAV